MTSVSFFDETTEQSRVKHAIVSKYFDAWANIIMPTAKKQVGKIAYIDLFAGPGRYNDGTRSTPLLVLERAIHHPEMREMLVTLFNDGDPDSADSLKAEIEALLGVERLKYKPQVASALVGDEIATEFEKIRFVPTLFFMDPWGYKGLSLRLINAALKDWGCDCIFFFNYNRINMGLPNSAVQSHIDALFGAERARELRNRLDALSPEDRELTIVEELAQALQEMGGRYVLPFRFRNENGTRTSHHLVFVSKHIRGYTLMKDIMARESSKQDQGVPSFEYSPADRRYPLLFELSRPLDDLAGLLLDDYAGRCITMRMLYEEHNVGRPYIERNYKDVLRRLEARGEITADPPAAERPKRNGEVTFGEKVRITFPAKKGHL